jgi:hypothetical protein
MPATRRLRSIQQRRAESASKAIPRNEPGLLIGTWGMSLACAPLELTHNQLAIADPWIDQGNDLKELVNAAEADQRRIYLILNDFPTELFDKIAAGRTTRWLHKGDAQSGDIGLIEILPQATNAED